ncbi:hypothetical protein ABIB87_004635 [Bradyrhizobium sp. JR18.2]
MVVRCSSARLGVANQRLSLEQEREHEKCEGVHPSRAPLHAVALGGKDAEEEKDDSNGCRPNEHIRPLNLNSAFPVSSPAFSCQGHASSKCSFFGGGSQRVNRFAALPIAQLAASWLAIQKAAMRAEVRRVTARIFTSGPGTQFWRNNACSVSTTSARFASPDSHMVVNCCPALYYSVSLLLLNAFDFE